jgi:hypothetical protein
VGTTFRGTSQLVGRKIEWTSVVIEYEPNRKLRQQMTAGPMSLDHALILEPVDNGTRFTIKGEGTFGGVFRLADALVNRRLQTQTQIGLTELKRTLEQRP